jgi:trimethylamine:corrinoid methyltransferase-like protein
LPMQLLDELASSVGQMDPDMVVVLSKRAVDAGIDPAEIVENGIAKGLRKVGERLENGEAFLNAFLNAVAGIDLTHNCGTIAHGSSGSLEMGVICDEIISYIQRLLMEIEISDETLAVDLIRRIGPAGNYMAEKHTRTRLQRGEILHPKLFNRQAIADWKAKRQLSTRDGERQKVKTILQEHKTPALASEVLQQIDEILRQASQTMR